MGKAVAAVGSALTGGLIGGPEKKQPDIRTPRADTKTSIDPNRSAQIAAAKKRQASAAGKSGRSNLRIDLEEEGTVTRGGISIS